MPLPVCNGLRSGIVAPGLAEVGKMWSGAV